MRINRSAAPIFVAVLLLMIVLYVGSYLALVKPNPFAVRRESMGDTPSQTIISYDRRNYRCFENACGSIFWPLEHIDRKVRPGVWQ